MVQLLEGIRQTGPEVILVGYVEPLSADGEAGSCQPLETRFDTQTMHPELLG